MRETIFNIVLVLLFIVISFEVNASQNKKVYAYSPPQIDKITNHTINDVYLDKFGPANLQNNHLKNLQEWVKISKNGQDFSKKNLKWDSMNYDALLQALRDYKQSSTGVGLSPEIQRQAEVGKIVLEKMDPKEANILKENQSGREDIMKRLEHLFSKSSQENQDLKSDQEFLEMFVKFLNKNFNEDTKDYKPETIPFVHFMLSTLFSKESTQQLANTHYSALAHCIHGIRSMHGYEEFIDKNKALIGMILKKLKNNAQLNFDEIFSNNEVLLKIFQELYPQGQAKQKFKEVSDEKGEEPPGIPNAPDAPLT